jgi:hypothetical protein
MLRFSNIPGTPLLWQTLGITLQRLNTYDSYRLVCQSPKS